MGTAAAGGRLRGLWGRHLFLRIEELISRTLALKIGRKDQVCLNLQAFFPAGCAPPPPGGPMVMTKKLLG